MWLLENDRLCKDAIQAEPHSMQAHFEWELTKKNKKKSPARKLDLDFNLNRTDTTLDLSQKAEKVKTQVRVQQPSHPTVHTKTVAVQLPVFGTFSPFSNLSEQLV
jgi:hypothetical protein